MLDSVEPIPVRHVNVVGVEREAKILGVDMDSYQRMIEDSVRNSQLTEPLKTMLATSIDIITYKGMEVVRIRVPRQDSLSFVGDEAYYRTGSSTQKATAPQVAALAGKFKP